MLKISNEPNETSRMRRIKAQIRLTESIAVLFIFMLMVGIGMIFYFNAQKASISRKAEEDKSLKIVEIVLKVSAMPELQCPAEVNVRNCIDLQMLKALAQRINSSPDLRDSYYYNIFLSSRIVAEIKHNDFDTADRRSLVLYDKSLPNEESFHEIIPVVFYNSTGDKGIGRKGEFYFGIINITYTV